MTIEDILAAYAEMTELDLEEVREMVVEGEIDRWQLFDKWLQYEGIIGYTDLILRAWKLIKTNVEEF